MGEGRAPQGQTSRLGCFARSTGLASGFARLPRKPAGELPALKREGSEPRMNKMPCILLPDLIAIAIKK